MKSVTRNIFDARQDRLLVGVPVERGFKIARRVRSNELTRLSLGHVESIRSAGGTVFLGLRDERFGGSVVLADSRAIHKALVREQRTGDWEEFRQRPLKSYLGHVAQLAAECKFPRNIQALGSPFFTETIGEHTLIACGLTGWPKEPDYPVQQLIKERAATLGALEEMQLPELDDNNHITLKVASFPGYIPAATIDPIVNNLNTAAENVSVAVHLRPLIYVAFLGK